MIETSQNIYLTTEMNFSDICGIRHGGNRESEAANQRAGKTKTRDQLRVLEACNCQNGATCRELAALWNCGMNAISGRFSELKAKGAIVKIGVRDHCGVYQALP